MTVIAYVFPGQGSQSVGMLQELSARYPLIIDLFTSVSQRVGYDVWDLVQNGPQERLNQTEQTQVAMLTADVAVYQLLQQLGAPRASIMAGHSLGEYAALVCAGAIDLPDAAELVGLRGKLMQQNVPLGQGAMAAIVGLTDAQVLELCATATTATHQVTPANYNAIGQVVIAGHTPAVEKAIALADEMGARMAVNIPVSVPCHCPLLAQASEIFGEELRKAPFKTPIVPVISNVDLSIYQSEEQIKTLLTHQLCEPVRWVETIQMMKNKGVELLIECGPGKILSGLTKRIDKTLDAMSVNDQSSLELALTALQNQDKK